MTGRRFGALTALGLSCDIGKFAKWVCRCDCGIYVLRSAKSLKNPYAWADACSRCQAKKRIKGQRDKSSVQSWDKDPHNPENRREA